MSRSRYKSCTKKQGFINWVCYFSNKEDKTITHRMFRRKSKAKLYKDLVTNNLENHLNFEKMREIRDVWDFDSDGLKFFVFYKDIASFYNEENIRHMIQK